MSDSLKDRILNLSRGDKQGFNQLALEVFRYQATNNVVYNEYISHLSVDSTKVSSIEEIPFLPISFFKRHRISTLNSTPERIFTSSGTTGSVTSRHELYGTKWYEAITTKIWNEYYPSLENCVILALLPGYLEREGSSLIYMVDHFIKSSGDARNGFFLYDHDKLYHLLQSLKGEGKTVVLFGVTFGLLDFAESYSLSFPELIIMETGGMKGRRKEMTRQEVHTIIKKSFGVERVHSEYGMTELLSQAYSNGNGIFAPSSTLDIILRDTNDPFSYVPERKTGGVNVIDLANVDTCSFIETQDLGRKYDDGTFEVLGRFDNSDIRGCNLMVL
ncbi:long-chain-fatty-acid--protein ligase [Marinigracilibium pacificum]|uniref:Acyl transferase n=1 Tax=Marinigracilibium pacificum TaxID=2729599 RepID=A0A848J5K2_9BACT|nr:acyl transferase [Marinigracilibium pacificum]NMM50528.1 acyl transferase [Marinigracilibium pacificum]